MILFLSITAVVSQNQRLTRLLERSVRHLCVAMACSKTDAERAVKGYEKSGAEVDHTDLAHVQAYIEMRNFSKRITADAFATYLRKRKVDVNTGSQVRLPYWGVPKKNFPSGLPSTVLGSEFSASEVSDLELYVVPLLVLFVAAVFRSGCSFRYSIPSELDLGFAPSPF